MRVLTLLPLIVACGGDKDDTSTTDTDTDATATGATATGTGTGAATGTGTGATGTGTGSTSDGIGELSRQGSATVTADAYVGTEDLVFVDDKGEGEELCRISYEVASTGTRADCAVCLWAFDLVFSNPQVITDSGVCLAVTGYDATNLAELDGLTASRGYDPDYVGHAEVLVFHDGNNWVTGSYAEFDDASGDFQYDWFDSFIAY